MPATLVNADSSVLCAHAAQAKALASQPRVKVAGSPVVTISSQYQVSGCTNPTTSGGPCTTARFIAAAGRIRAAGSPVLLQNSQSASVPTGAPLTVAFTQLRVKGS